MDNGGNSSPSNRDRDKSNARGIIENCPNIFVSKADGLWAAYAVIFAFVAFLFYQLGVISEKVSTLEDIVFKQEYRIERVKK